MVLALRLKEPLIILLIVLAIVGAVVVLYLHRPTSAATKITNIQEGKSVTAQSSRYYVTHDAENMSCITVTVKGTGTAYARPIGYRLMIVIQNEEPSKNVSQIVRTVTEKYRRILEILTLDGFKVFTRSIELVPEYSWVSSHRVLVGYVFRITIDAYTNEISRVEYALPEITSLASYVSLSYMYNVSDVYNVALKKALTSAIRKLRFIAEILNASTYRIVSISETYYYVPSPLAGTLVTVAKVPISPPSTKVQSTVIVKGLVCFRNLQTTDH